VTVFAVIAFSPYSAILLILQDDMDLLLHGQPKKIA
jgi:hypothetical protein